MSAVRALMTGVFLATLWLPAGAAPEDYCAAYARDFADAGKRDDAIWKRRFDDATTACMAQFSAHPDRPAEKPVVQEAMPKDVPALVDQPVVPKKKPQRKRADKPVKKLAAAPTAEEALETPAEPVQSKLPKKQKPKKKVVAKREADEPLVDVRPEPAVIVAPDIEPPQQAVKVKKPTVLSVFRRLFGTDGQAQKPAPQVVPASGKLQPGSVAWLDYCDRKYASFNRSTGTYVSRTGVVRKCKVTRD